jgi:glycine cleavage system aminomethyltransferase T
MLCSRALTVVAGCYTVARLTDGVGNPADRPYDRPMAPCSPVAAILEQAGATMVDRAGRPVPLHFGSSAGELAACTVTVGLADRSDLAIHAIEGDVAAVEHVTLVLTGTLIAAGGAVAHDAAMWCTTSPGRLLVAGERACGERLAARLAGAVGRHPGLTLRALSDAVAAFELLGPRTEDTLSALGLPATLAPAVQTARIGGRAVTVLRRSPVRALVLTDPASAPPAWEAVDHAAAPFGVTCVGADAVARFRFVESLLSG